MAAPHHPTEVEYPESDGKPMAESDLHRKWMFRIIELLQSHFAGQRVYVSGNLLIYYVEGDPRKSVAPDAFVVKDCDPRERKVFKTWEEGRTPQFVLETTSASTRKEDLVDKMRLYSQLRVSEYFLYDPLGEWLDPPLLGFRLNGNGYVPLEPEGEEGIESAELGITFRLDRGHLVLLDSATGAPLLTSAEQRDVAERCALEAAREAQNAKQLAQEAKQQAQEAEARLRALEIAIRALEEENKRLRSERAAPDKTSQ